MIKTFSKEKMSSEPVSIPAPIPIPIPVSSTPNNRENIAYSLKHKPNASNFLRNNSKEELDEQIKGRNKGRIPRNYFEFFIMCIVFIFHIQSILS
jgi:hypothetical protein